MTDLQHQKTDQSELLQAECIDIAKQSWLINQHPPFVVGFKDNKRFTMPMPRFISNQEMQSIFFETVSLEEDWDAIAMFNYNGRGSVCITLLVVDKLTMASADIIDDYGGQYLSEFGKWQDVNDSNLSLVNCLSRDVVNSIQKRAVNYG